MYCRILYSSYFTIGHYHSTTTIFTMKLCYSSIWSRWICIVNIKNEILKHENKFLLVLRNTDRSITNILNIFSSICRQLGKLVLILATCYIHVWHVGEHKKMHMYLPTHPTNKHVHVSDPPTFPRYIWLLSMRVGGSGAWTHFSPYSIQRCTFFKHRYCFSFLTILE